MDEQRYKISTDYDKHKRKRKLFPGFCLWCKKEFWFPKHLKRKYCSKECGSAAKVINIETECAWCKKIFKKQPSDLINSKSGLYFCERACKDKAQCIGGIKAIQPLHYGRGEGKYDYRSRSDLSKCVGCGEARKFVLVVHHINRDRSVNTDDNLETVCGVCHMIRHLSFNGEEWVYNPQAITPRELLSSF